MTLGELEIEGCSKLKILDGLERKGIRADTRIEEVAANPLSFFRALHGVGPQSVSRLEAALARHGLKLARHHDGRVTWRTKRKSVLS